jgi:hypothetical protein
MRTIFKYPLTNVDFDDGTEFGINLPEGATIISCQLQQGKPTLWAEVDTDLGQEARRFIIYSTGSSSVKDEPVIYVGTVLMDSGSVWHIYELVPEIEEGIEMTVESRIRLLEDKIRRRDDYIRTCIGHFTAIANGEPVENLLKYIENTPSDLRPKSQKSQ